MGKTIKFAIRFVENIIAVLLMLMMLMVFVNAILRYSINSGIDVSEEMARYMFVWLTFLAAMAASLDNSHIKAGAIAELLPYKSKIAVKLAAQFIVLGCCLLLTVSSWRHMGANWRNVTPISGLPLALLFLSGALGGVGMAIIAIRDGIRLFIKNDAAATADECEDDR